MRRLKNKFLTRFFIEDKRLSVFSWRGWWMILVSVFSAYCAVMANRLIASRIAHYCVYNKAQQILYLIQKDTLLQLCSLNNMFILDTHLSTPITIIVCIYIVVELIIYNAHTRTITSCVGYLTISFFFSNKKETVVKRRR